MTAPGYTGLTGRVDDPIGVVDEIDAIEALVALIGVGATAPDDQANEGAAFLSRIVGDRLNELKDYLAARDGVGSDPE